jgi:hypothetical protein
MAMPTDFSYPYFNLAREEGIDYGTILNLADGIQAGRRGEEPRIWYEMAWEDVKRQRGDQAHALFAKVGNLVYRTMNLFDRNPEPARVN